MPYTLTTETPVEMVEELNEQANVDFLDYLSAQQRTLLEEALASLDPDLPVETIGRYPPRSQLRNRYANRYGKHPDSITVIGVKPDRTGNVDLRIVVPKTEAKGGSGDASTKDASHVDAE